MTAVKRVGPTVAMGLAMGLFVIGARADAEPAPKPTLKPAAKPAPKPKPEAFTDPAKAGVDFAIQGEYATPADAPSAWGAQVVALGDGAFDVYALKGGLPGAGWDTKTRLKAAARRPADKPTITLESPALRGELTEQGPLTLTIAGSQGDNAPLTVTLVKVVRTSPTLGAEPPPGATVLFNGQTADEFVNGKLVTDHDGPSLFCGVTSRKTFSDASLHIEFRLSFMPKARGQARSNSGVYMAGRYEIQVLDSFGLTGENNECGGLYEVARPAVNMCFPPLTWQTYDIDYTAPRFDETGQRTTPAKVTVRHNGVLIHEDVEFSKGITRAAPVKEAPTPGPLYLQNHGDPVHFRNIWYVEKSTAKP